MTAGRIKPKSRFSFFTKASLKGSMIEPFSSARMARSHFESSKDAVDQPVISLRASYVSPIRKSASSSGPVEVFHEVSVPMVSVVPSE